MYKSEKFWDRLSKHYDKPDKINEVLEYQSIEYIRKYLNINDIILDFGCATGTVAFSLADKVQEIHGIDISSKMIQVAEKRSVAHKIENATFSQSTIFDNKYKDQTFNMILAFSIIHLLENTDRIIQKINLLLKKGGYFISLTPCLGEKKFLSILSLLGYKIGLLPYIRRFTIIELEKSITDSDFQIIDSKCLDNNPLEYFIIAKKL